MAARACGKERYHVHQAAKNDRMPQLMQIVAILLLLSLLFWIIATGTDLFRDTVEETAAREITFAEKDYFDGYVFRDEAVFTSRNNGPVDYNVKEGQALAAGDMVAEVYIDDSGKDKRERAALLYDEIERLTAALTAMETGADTGTLNASYRALMQSVSSGSWQAAAPHADDVSAALLTHGAVSGSAEDYRARIAALESEATALVQYVSLPETVTSGAAGRFSKTVDGYEALFGLSAAVTLSPEALDTLLQNPLDTKGAIGKLVLGNGWYVVLPTAREATLSYTVGEHYAVEFTQSNTSLTMQLARIAPSEDGTRALLLFYSEEVPQGFDFERRQTVAITRQLIKGIYVPAATLRREGSETFLYVSDNGQALRRPVKLLYDKNGCIIAATDAENGIVAGARLLVTERRLFDGKPLGTAQQENS